MRKASQHPPPLVWVPIILMSFSFSTAWSGPADSVALEKAAQLLVEASRQERSLRDKLKIEEIRQILGGIPQEEAIQVLLRGHTYLNQVHTGPEKVIALIEEAQTQGVNPRLVQEFMQEVGFTDLLKDARIAGERVLKVLPGEINKGYKGETITVNHGSSAEGAQRILDGGIFESNGQTVIQGSQTAIRDGHKGFYTAAKAGEYGEVNLSITLRADCVEDRTCTYLKGFDWYIIHDQSAIVDIKPSSPIPKQTTRVRRSPKEFRKVEDPKIEELRDSRLMGEFAEQNPELFERVVLERTGYLFNFETPRDQELLKKLAKAAPQEAARWMERIAFVDPQDLDGSGEFYTRNNRLSLETCIRSGCLPRETLEPVFMNALKHDQNLDRALALTSLWRDLYDDVDGFADAVGRWVATTNPPLNAQKAAAKTAMERATPKTRSLALTVAEDLVTGPGLDKWDKKKAMKFMGDEPSEELRAAVLGSLLQEGNFAKTESIEVATQHYLEDEEIAKAVLAAVREEDVHEVGAGKRYLAASPPGRSLVIELIQGEELSEVQGFNRESILELAGELTESEHLPSKTRKRLARSLDRISKGKPAQGCLVRILPAIFKL